MRAGLRGRSLVTTSLVLVLAVTAPACGDDGGTDAGAHLAGGEELYDRTCAACHGADLDGTSAGPPLRHRIYEPSHHPDDSFRRAVSHGVTPHHWDHGPMPPIPELSAGEVDAIVAYVRERQQRDGFIE
jgi:mono/diheme cytochrome c family protein